MVLLSPARLIVAPARRSSCGLRVVCTSSLWQLCYSSDKRKKGQYNLIVVPIADEL